LFKSESLIRQILAPQAAAGAMPEKGILSRTLAVPRDLFRSGYRFIHDIPSATPLDDWVDDVVDHLTVDIVKKTNLISVSHRQRADRLAATRDPPASGGDRHRSAARAEPGHPVSQAAHPRERDGAQPAALALCPEQRSRAGCGARARRGEAAPRRRALDARRQH